MTIGPKNLGLFGKEVDILKTLLESVSLNCYYLTEILFKEVFLYRRFCPRLRILGDGEGGGSHPGVHTDSSCLTGRAN